MSVIKLSNIDWLISNAKISAFFLGVKDEDVTDKSEQLTHSDSESELSDSDSELSWLTVRLLQNDDTLSLSVKASLFHHEEERKFCHSKPISDNLVLYDSYKLGYILANIKK